MRQFTHTVARNSSVGMIAQMAIKLLSFGFSILIVRNLGVEAFGQYVAIGAFGSLFLFIGDLGLSTYAVREVARWRGAPNDASTNIGALYGNLLTIRVLLSILSGLLLLAAAWLTGRPWVMIMALALNTSGMVLYGIQGSSDAILSGYERLDLSATAKVSYQLIFVTLGAAALLLGMGYYGLIYATLIAIVFLTIVCWRNVIRLGVRPRRPNIRNWLPLLRASLPFGVIGFTLGLSYKFDSVLLNIFRSDSETGYYNAAYNLVFATAVLSNVINTALYPSLTRQAATGPEALPAIYARTLRYLMVLALPIAVGAATLADQIVPFLFKAAYLPAVPALQMVIWVVPLMYCSEFLGYVVLIRGQERSAARAIVTSTTINVILNLVLVPMFGFVGAAIMTVITEAILVGQYIWMLRAEMRQLDWGVIVVRPLLAALVMGGTVLALRFLPLLLNIPIGALVYGALLLLLGVVGRDELRFVCGLRHRAEAVL
jgi:O-antigen/teichoic acid export membrane protein